MTKLTAFRWIANLEGISFLVLLLIAMPLKYMWDKPWMVQQVGMAHGVLFVGYVIAVFLVKKQLSWNTKQTLIALALSFVPLGTFYVTGKMMDGKPDRSNMISSRFLSVIILLLLTCPLKANVRLPKIFGDNMVLQRDKPISVWGWASPGEKVTVSFHGQTLTTKALKDSSWRVSFSPIGAGGPYTLSVQGKNIITINNILIGEVWVASGQSNMEWPVRLAANAEEEISKSDFPMIRHFKVPSTVSGTPQADIPPAEWQIAGPATVGNFSAVSYFFARKIYNELHVPIGIINSSWGGTVAETWMSREALESQSDFNNVFKQVKFADIEAKNEKEYNEAAKQLQATAGSIDGTDAGQWKNLTWDDSKWKILPVPVNFNENGLEKFDGIIWFRKTVQLSREDVLAETYLELGTIDDRDETYVNGQLVGTTDNYNNQREYRIPAGLLKEGANVIAVRVHDQQGNGGFFSKPSAINIVCGIKTISLAGDWRYRIESLNKNGINPNIYPSLLFNSEINPIRSYTVRGVIWYQGESNVDRAYQYRSTFPLLINDWRKQFNDPELPFYYVQLASYNAANGNSEAGSKWAELREAQTKTLALKNTGMAVAFDIGESGDIHPKNKQDVGLRLAAIALNKLYGKSIPYAGPQFQSMKLSGNKAILEFTNAESGFNSSDKWGYIRGFEIAGADKKFYYAQAETKGNQLIISSDSVKTPVAVRCGWADDMPEANLYNKQGFPAVPFRTDDWNTVTLDQKYRVEK